MMVLAMDTVHKGHHAKTLEPDGAAVEPLASPPLVGPRTMASLIVLEGTKSLLDLLMADITLVVLTGLILRFSSAIGRLLGGNELKADSRFITIILAALGAQTMHDALLA